MSYLCNVHYSYYLYQFVLVILISINYVLTPYYLYAHGYCLNNTNANKCRICATYVIRITYNLILICARNFDRY